MPLRAPADASPPPRASLTPPAAQPATATDYTDFVIQARRKDGRTVEVRVHESQAGDMKKPHAVVFPAEEAEHIHAQFRADQRTNGQGRMLLTQEEATKLGKRLAAVIFPAPVFRLLSECIADAVRRPSGGLRIRLALDESLVDLPWEYVYRPDRIDSEGVSGFLLLDPTVSVVREAANPRISLEPIKGRQRLHFVGALWEGGKDTWEVRKEFELLSKALKPLRDYISPSFAVGGNADAFDKDFDRGAAIFHYAGHCDFDVQGRAFLIREMSSTGTFEWDARVYADDMADALARSKARLVVLSACNSGYWPVVKPLLDAGVAAVVGINGAVASISTIEFCAKMYESLAVGLTLDEAVDRARLHLCEWSLRQGRFDWGLFMVYMPAPQGTLFPRERDKAVAARQKKVQSKHNATIESALQMVRRLDDANFGELMSEMTKRRVLILGRFTGRRLKILKAIQARLEEHPNRYKAELFVFDRPELRDLVESIIGFAAFSRFIVADLSEPKSIQSELEAIVPHFMSLPVVPIINRTGKEYATFSSIRRRQNVVQPTVRYRDLDDLLEKLDGEVVPNAEAKLDEVRPPARR